MFDNSLLLKGQSVQLEVLKENHFDALELIAKDERIWPYTSYKPIGPGFSRWFNKAMTEYRNKRHLPFVVIHQKTGKLIGSTRLYDIVDDHKRVTLGYTWYIPDMWGSAVNPECKYLLLQYIFETLKYHRVEFAIDSRNLRSQAAVKKLGAKEEGILRHHMILDDGIIRDTVVFSIIQSEWPEIKTTLLKRIQ